MAEIVVCDISKKFGQQVVLDHISMKLSSPHIYGLVGRNGSGKTMLMRHLCGFVRPDSGKILIDGKVLNKEIEKPEKLGIIIENPGFLPEYSGYYNLHLFALIQNKIKKEEIREAMRIVGLDAAPFKLHFPTRAFTDADGIYPCKDGDNDVPKDTYPCIPLSGRRRNEILITPPLVEASYSTPAIGITSILFISSDFKDRK